MKKIVRYSILLALPAIVFFSCNDFIEEDISKETINLLAPGNNLTTVQLTHTFWWDWLEGAEQYNMQLVEGSFSAVTTFILDTTITNNKFVYTLYPGSFQWRVKGMNNGGDTYYTTFNLTIDSTLDISSLQVVLTTPLDNDTINYNNVTLDWNSLLNADDYLIEVHENTWGGNLVFGPQVVTSNTYTATLPEGTLVWGVQGRNGTTGTSTVFSTRTLVVDTTAPNMVTLLTPVDNAILTDTYNSYTWTQGTNTGTPLTDRIYFYDDASATNLVKTSLTSGTTYIDSLGVDTFYWAVQSTDAAGNVGPFSNLRKVIIQ